MVPKADDETALTLLVDERLSFLVVLVELEVGGWKELVEVVVGGSWYS